MKNINYRTVHSGLTLFFVLLIAFWMPLYKYYLSLFIIAWLVLTFTDRKLLYSIKLSYSDEKVFYFGLQVVFFLIICLGILISDSKDKAIEIVMMKISFLVFPILFLINSEKLVKYKDHILKIFIAGNVIASIICLAYAFMRSLNIIDNEIYFYNFDLLDNNYFRYNKLSIFHHPSYFSMYLLFSLASLFYLSRKGDRTILAIGKFVFYFLIFFHVLMIFMLSSKAGMLISLGLILREFILFIKRKKGITIKLIGIFTVLIGLIFFMNNNRIKIALKSMRETYQNGKENEAYPIRLILWESATELIWDNFWLGVGTGDTKSVFSEKNKELQDKEPKIMNFNVHNQFLETQLSSGFIGFGVLMTLFVAAIVRAVKKKEELFLIFLIIVLLNFLVESMLNTIAGITFIVYFYNFFLIPDESRKKL